MRCGSRRASEILDIACGYGRHAIELVQRGYNVTGLDLSLPLLIRAADEAQRRALSVNFVHADMREMAFEKQFDGAYSMLTSFGYFDEETNLRVAERIGRALKPGARFLLDIVNRDYVVSDLPVRVWWEGTGCVVLEEVDFNFHTSRIVTHRSIVFEDGRQLEQEISVRAYSLHEIGRLLRQAGFRVMDVSGGLNTRGQFFGNASRSLLIVAEKREADAEPSRSNALCLRHNRNRRSARVRWCAPCLRGDAAHVRAEPCAPLQPKRRRKHLSLRDERRSNPEYLFNEVRISLKGPEKTRWTAATARWRSRKMDASRAKARLTRKSRPSEADAARKPRVQFIRRRACRVGHRASRRASDGRRSQRTTRFR